MLACVVSETVRKDAYILKSGTSSTNISAYELYGETDAIFIKECPQVHGLHKQAANINFVLTYDANISNEQKNDINNKIKAYSYTLIPYEKLLANTRDAMESMLQEKLPAPLFFAIMGKFSCFSLSLIFIMRKMKELTIKRLAGCSHFKSVCSAIVMMCLPETVAVVLNLFLWKSYPVLSKLRIISFGAFRISSDLYILFIFDFIITAIIIILAVYFVYWNKSLIQLVRRFEQKA